jgi:integrase
MALVLASKKYPGVLINKLKNGDVSFYVNYRDEDNISRKVKVGTKTKHNNFTVKDAYDCLIEIKHSLSTGEDISQKRKRKERFTFNDAFKDYMQWAKGSKKSWKKDEELYFNHLSTLTKKELIFLKRKDFEQIKVKKLKTLSPRTVEYILAVARQIINHAIDEELVKNYDNPLRRKHGQSKGIMPKVDNEKLAFLSHEQAKKLLSMMKIHHKTSYYFSVLMLFTGARFDEVARLIWQNVDFESGLLHIEPSKNGNARKVAITPIVSEVLNNLKVDMNSMQSPVIPNSKGKRWDRMPKQWQTKVDMIFPDNIEAGKYRITPHSLRHTHASWLAKNGTDILRIKEQLGHKKLDMTLRYAHLIPDERHDKTRELFEKFKENS